MAGHEHEVPCFAEGGAFMSPEPHTIFTEHPYKVCKIQEYSHFLPTPLTYPPFSLPARPFSWLMRTLGGDKAHTEHLAQTMDIDFHPEKEPDLDFNSNWVQDADNVRAIFHSFYEDIKIGHSLVIVYAKQVPFIEDDPRRVVIGIGHIKSVTPPSEYNYDTDNPPLRSVMWETMIGHSIRPDMTDGFLLPYREMMDYAKKVRGKVPSAGGLSTAKPDAAANGFDLEDVAVFVDDQWRDEFSYATERVSYDAVISILHQAIKSLTIADKCIPDKGDWRACIRWCKERLAEAWQDRGATTDMSGEVLVVSIQFLSKEVAQEGGKNHSTTGLAAVDNNSMIGYMYILRCRDGTYYVGSTNNMELRLAEHHSGHGANYTKCRRPVELVYYEQYEYVADAFNREKQVQGWSRKKREALINGEYPALPALAKKVFRKDFTSQVSGG